jgi:hypothetical protein
LIEITGHNGERVARRRPLRLVNEKPT